MKNKSDSEAGAPRRWRRDTMNTTNLDEKEPSTVDEVNMGAQLTQKALTGRARLVITLPEDEERSYFRRFKDAAVRFHEAAKAQARSRPSNSNTDSRRPSISTTYSQSSRRGFYHPRYDDQSTWASGGVGALPGSMSEADLIISARRGGKEYKWSREGGGRRGGRPGLPRRESTNTASDGEGVNPAPINCIVVDHDFASFMASSNVGTHKREKTEEESLDIDIEKAEAAPSIYPNMSEISHSPRHRSWRWTCRVVRDNFLIPLKSFADLSFDDPARERAFQKEQWFSSRPGALLACLYILALFIGTLALQTPWTIFYSYAYAGVCGALTLPLIFLVIFNVPMRSFWFYQLALLAAAWVWAFVFVIEMSDCHFFSLAHNNCSNRKYLDFFATVQGLPALALIALRQNRVLHCLASTVWFTLLVIRFWHEEDVALIFWRNAVTSEIFNLFFAGVSYFKERADRQLFSLRAQLKEQYRAVQSAQAMERRAEHSKKRFVSYIFHEVRVPLNTARLALANLDGESAFWNMSDDHKDLILGLDGSLKMMEQVLNDVLSFNRMESGNLTLARKPFSFHRAVQYVGLAHRSTAEVVGLDFELVLDPRIDTMGGVVLGDEMRFKQICSNLISNAFKFTHTGGVKLVTQLLYPVLPKVEGTVIVPSKQCDDTEEASENEGPSQLLPRKSVSRMSLDKPRGRSARSRSTTRTTETSTTEATVTPQRHFTKAVIRIEVHDTGVGLSLSDVRDNRLFSPYVQTEIGRRQGGKGSGLGLALVTQIVKLSGGRLGVDSEPDKGSVFWFELPYTIPPTIEKHPDLAPQVVPPLTFSRRVSSSEKSSGSGRRSSVATLSGPIPSVAEPQMPQMSEASALRPCIHPVAHLRLDLNDRAPSPRSAPNRTLEPPAESPGVFEPLLPPRPMSLDGEAPPSPESPPATPGGMVLVSPLDSSRSSSVPAAAVGVTESGSELPAVPPPTSLSPPHAPAFVQRPVPLRMQAFAAPLVITPPPPAASSSSAVPMPTVLASPPSPRSSLPSPPVEPPPLPSPILPMSPVHGQLSVPTNASEVLNALVVDDDSLTRKLMSRMLRRLGHNVTQAADGKAALALIMANHKDDGKTSPRFDIVFLDNQMPTMFGVEVAREVRALGIPIYIVGCTGNALREDQDEYLAAGADDVIPKPVAEIAIRQQLAKAKNSTRKMNVRVGGVRIDG